MTTFFRAQGKGICFKKMQSFKSHHEGKRVNGITCSMKADGHDSDQAFGGALGAMNDDDEIVIFEGTKVEKIYDGYIATPNKEIARFTIAQWYAKLNDGSAWEYENY